MPHLKVCLSCQHRFSSDSWRCPACQFEPKRDGFVQFAPALSESNDGFEAVSFEYLARLEPTSFWFRSRNRLVVQLLQTHFPTASTLLEIGCGTGYVLSSIAAAFPRLRVTGAELYTAGLRFAADRLPGATLYQMDCRRMPFDCEFDVVCAFDVLEHVEEDGLALEQMRLTVKPGGGVLISVPQHRSLWSASDDFAHHKRRYRRRELIRKLTYAGLEVVQITSFVSSLLPLLVASRAIRRMARSYDCEAEYRMPRVLDRTFELLLDGERRLIRAGVSVPAGGSLFAVARRRL